MERFYTCINGHLFKVTGEGDEPPDDEKEVYFCVPCPSCETPYEIHWPSHHAFKVVPK